jgi:hypothetical protein
MAFQDLHNLPCLKIPDVHLVIFTPADDNLALARSICSDGSPKARN